MYKNKATFFSELENSEKNNFITPPPMPVTNPQTPKNMEKNDFPIYFMGFCGLKKFNSKK